MSSSNYSLPAELSSIFGNLADNIRLKYNINSKDSCPITANDIASNILALAANAQPYAGTVDDFLNHTLSYISSPISIIKPYTFQSQSLLTSIYFPNVVTVGSSAFWTCRSLSGTISFPYCTYIAPYAFGYCSKIDTVILPVCSRIASNAFNPAKIRSFSIPKVTYIGTSAFGLDSTAVLDNIIPLATLDLPECSYIEDYAFKTAYSGTVILGSGILYGRFKQLSLPKCTYLGALSFTKLDTASNNSYMPAYDSDSLSYLDLPECSTIGSFTFSYYENLLSANLPKLNRLSNSTFRFCTNLESFNAPNLKYIGEETFAYCRKLDGFGTSMPELISIPAAAFEGCSNLKSLWLSECSAIGRSAFVGCVKLSAIFLFSKNCTLWDDDTTWSQWPFHSTPMSTSTYLGYYGSIYVPASYVSSYKAMAGWSRYADRITSLPQAIEDTYVFKEAYMHDAELTAIPESKINVSYILNSAFFYCSNLSEVKLDNLLTISSNAFGYCQNLKTASAINLKKIDENAFSHCYNLSSVNFPQCSEVGERAFEYCSALSSAVFASTLIEIPHGCFSSAGLSEVPNASLIKYIGSYALYNTAIYGACSLPNVSYIGSYALWNCPNLEKLTVNNPAIAYGAFATCLNLSEICIKGNASISNYAFGGCYALKNVYLCYSEVISGDNIFGTIGYWNSSYFKELKIHVLSSLVSKYRITQGWSTYSKYFVGHDSNFFETIE